MDFLDIPDFVAQLDTRDYTPEPEDDENDDEQ